MRSATSKWNRKYFNLALTTFLLLSVLPCAKFVEPSGLLSTDLQWEMDQQTVWALLFVAVDLSFFSPPNVDSFICHLISSLCVCANLLQPCPLFATPWTVAHQAPLSMGFSRQEYQSGLPFPSPGDLPDPGIEPGALMSPALQAGSLPAEPSWNRLLDSRSSQFQLSWVVTFLPTIIARSSPRLFFMTCHASGKF